MEPVTISIPARELAVKDLINFGGHMVEVVEVIPFSDTLMWIHVKGLWLTSTSESIGVDPGLSVSVQRGTSDPGTFRVRWSRGDVFSDAGPYDTASEAQEYALEVFAVSPPDAWWVEKVTTVEFHDQAAVAA